MVLVSFLEESTGRAPDKTALVCGPARVSYRTLERAANRIAHGLRDLGVRRGDRVAVCLESSLEHVEALCGALKAGAVIMPVNATTKAEKLVRLLDDAEATVLVLGSHKLVAVGEAVARARTLRDVVVVGDTRSHPQINARLVAYDTLVDAGNPAPPPKRHIDVDLAALIYTSGSTGDPKGVMLTHQGLVSATRAIAATLGNHAGDVVVQVLPLSFGYGLTQLLTMLCVGGTLVLERSFAFPQVTLQRIAEERATGFAMVPTIAAMLLQYDLRAHDLSSLRYVTNAGAALPPPMLMKLRERLPHAHVIPMYGQTECVRASFMPATELDLRPGSVGRGMPNQDHWLVDEDGRRLPDGSTGELVVRGAHVMRGYWRKPELTQEKLRVPVDVELPPGERALFTGDIFRSDAEGFLYFVSRRDDIIKTRGEKVSPREIEAVLTSLDGVSEAFVAGVPDVVLGEAVHAWIVPAEGVALTERPVLRHCAAHLEDFAVPNTVVFVDELPRTANGKIDKQALVGNAGGSQWTSAATF